MKFPRAWEEEEEEAGSPGAITGNHSTHVGQFRLAALLSTWTGKPSPEHGL